MSDPREAPASGGLSASLRRFFATALELGQVRLELLGTELEEQKLRILAAFAWAALGVMLVGVGAVLLAGCVVLLFAEGYRLPAMAVLTLAFIAGGGLMLRHAFSRLKTPPGAFATSVAELARDRDTVVPRRNAPPGLP